jgi:hypothetical protein
MTRLQTFAGLIACGYLSWAVPARADAVADWDAIAIGATLAANPPHPGPTGFLDMAVVHVAVYTMLSNQSMGVSGLITLEFHKLMAQQRLLPPRPPTMCWLTGFLGRPLSLTRSTTTTFQKNGLCETDPGIAVGQQTAAAIVALRAKDGSFPNPAPPPFMAVLIPTSGVLRSRICRGHRPVFHQCLFHG